MPSSRGAADRKTKLQAQISLRSDSLVQQARESLTFLEVDVVRLRMLQNVDRVQESLDRSPNILRTFAHTIATRDEAKNNGELVHNLPAHVRGQHPEHEYF